MWYTYSIILSFGLKAPSEFNPSLLMTWNITIYMCKSYDKYCQINIVCGFLMYSICEIPLFEPLWFCFHRNVKHKTSDTKTTDFHAPEQHNIHDFVHADSVLTTVRLFI